MQFNIAQCVNKGMQRDYSMDKSSQEFAYENRNIRITTTGDESFLSVTNEKSTIKIPISLEMSMDNIALYNLTITRTGDDFDGIGKIETAIVDFITPLQKDAIFNLSYKTSYVTDNNRIISISKGVSSIDLMDYVHTNDSILSVRVWEHKDSPLFPVWKDHENIPSLPNLGTIIGTTTLENKIVIFSKINDVDYIIVGTIKNDIQEFLDCKYIYSGQLGFDTNHPIECITSYEADDIQKVYWVDGKNQPRVVNICKSYESYYSFDFTPNIPKDINVDIEKEYIGSGNFPSGIIQYYITFYNKFGPETSAAYESSLFYISPPDRGGSADEIQTCSFKINIKCQSKEFKYARVYSIIRTSYSATPQAYIVEDIKLDENEENIVIDTNILNTPIASTDILFLGGSTLTASTIEQKDNTLFLGNIRELSVDVTSDIKQIEFKGTLSFGSKFVKTNTSNNKYYQYSPNLTLSSKDIKTFKYLEWYKIGIQFQLKSGEWTSVVELGDIQNTVMPNSLSEETFNPNPDELDGGVWLPAIKFTPSEDLLEYLKNNSTIKSWRLVMAEHSSETRTIKTQGLVLPTLFNLKERFYETCYASPLWTLNTALYGEHLGTIDLDKQGVNTAGEVQQKFEMYPYFHLPSAFYKEKDGKHIKLNSVIENLNVRESQLEGKYLVSIQPLITIARYSQFISIYDGFTAKAVLGISSDSSSSVKYFTIELFTITYGAGNRRNALKEVSSEMYRIVWSDFWDRSLDSIKVSELKNLEKLDPVFRKDEIPSGDSLRDNYGVKAGNDITITLPVYLRDVVYTKSTEAIDDFGNQYFLDANICNFISPNIEGISKNLKFRIVGYTDIANSISDYNIDVEDSTIEGTTYRFPIHNFNTLRMNVYPKKKYPIGITSFPLWPYLNKLYYINYWHNGGNLIEDKFKIKSKSFANMWYCGNTTYTKPIEYGNIKDIITVDNESVLLDDKVYKANYQNVLFPKKNIVSYIGGGSTDDYPYKQPVNETTPLKKVIEAIEDADAEEPLSEAVSNVGAVNIKHNTAVHAVFKLSSNENFFSILPNYSPAREGDSFIYSSSTYPIGAKDVDYIFYIKSLSEGNIKGENYNESVSITLNKNKVTIQSSIINPKIKIKTDYAYNYQVDVKLGEEFTYRRHPSFADLYDDIQNSYGIYTGRVWLIKVEGINKYVVIKVKNNIVSSGNLITLSGTASVVSEDAIISVYNSDQSKKFLLSKVIDVDDLNTMAVFHTSKFSMFQTPEIEDTRYSSENPKLFIGEFYTDYDKSSFFGGNTQNCKFIPISEPYSVLDTVGWGLEGDTYYQRYDNVRIYGVNETDVNQNIDAVSFMLESYSNLDGDYRTHRGRLDTLNLRVDNTNNILNKVYSQPNNITGSYVLDSKFDDSTHPTLYAWSLTKQNLADIDTWTSINISNSLKLDGDKGTLNKIKRWNNQLLAFQDRGISVINFNQQTTISTSDGVPIEIANSGKVTGHYYISSTQGCKNKWSIVDSPYGLYFIDSYNKSINVFGSEGIKSLSTINLFQDWTAENEKGIVWDASDNGGFKSFYDPIHKEVYFVNDVTALCYNELLNQFTSFYDYGGLNSMLPLNGSIFGIKNGEIHRMFEGTSYCSLFGEPVGYSITYKVNNSPFLDKIWTNIEYRADIFNGGNIADNNADKILKETFDTLNVWNEYQSGTTNLMGSKYPNARCKFRIWRADIPRDSKSKRDRIRNPWIMLKLEKVNNTDKRMEFHDLIIKYLQ